MQVKHWKLVTLGLVLVILILCMMTFFLNSSNRNLLIQLNRMDREKAEMNRDYEKLYNAYYSYDKKILKILEYSDKVWWTEDSSFYALYDVKKEVAVFAFYKKPRLEKEYLLWPELIDKRTGDIRSDSSLSLYLQKIHPRVDTLRPHQFIMIGPPLKMVRLNIIPKDGNFEKDRARPGILFNSR